MRSVIKALDLLEAFSQNEPELGVSELSRRLRVPKTTISRLLATLSLRGYVRQDPKTERYRLGMRAWEVGYLACTQYGLREAAGPVMEEIHARTQETVNLTILSDDGYIVFLDRVQGTQPLHADTYVGGRALTYCTAHGKALLAFQPPDVVERMLKGRLKSFTSTTVSTLPALRKELGEVRARGYAVNRGEWRTDISGIASPLWDHSNRLVGAVGIAMPSFRATAELIESYGALVMKAADEISAALGWLGGGRGGGK